MADSSNGGIYIESSIDNRKLAAGAEQARRIIDSIGQAATKAGGQIDNSLTPDSTRLRSELNKANAQLKRLGSTARQEGDRINGLFAKIAAGIGAAFTVQKALEFARSVVSVRTEIARLEISFNSLLGSREKASQLMGEIRQFAVETPMMLGDLAKAAQMMLGFNVAAEEIMPMLKTLGNISMGDAGRFQSLALAFSQMSAAGRLMGQDLLQMINAGFNPLITISEKTGKSVKQLKEEMSEGAITAEMVTQAFKDAAAEGGKFYGILENQAKGVAGSIAYMRGAWENMLNELGKQTEEAVGSSFKYVGDLLKNYRQLGGVIADLVVAYGSYKAALIVCNALQATSISLTKGWTLAQLAQYRALLLVEKAQKLLNATVLKNPYVLAAAAVAGFVTAIFRANRAHGMAAQAAQDSADALGALNAKYDEQRNKSEELIDAVNSETASRTRQSLALEELKKMYPGIIEKYIDEQGHLVKLTELQKELNEARERGRIRENSDLLGDYRTKLRDYQQLLKAYDNGWDLASAGTTNNVNVLLEGKSFFQLKGNFLKEKVEYWQKMVEEQQKAVDADEDAQFAARLKESSDKELEELEKAFEDRREKFGELSEKDAADLQMIVDERKRRKPENINDNKEYYEKLKKEAEAELSALTAAEAAGAKGQALKAKIAQYQRKLAVFEPDTKGSGKKDDTDKKEKELGNSLAEEMEQLERKAQQAAINAIKDGHERKLKQIEQNYKEELAAVTKWEKEQVQKEEEIQKEKYRNAHGGSTEGFEPDTTTDNYKKIAEAAAKRRELAKTADVQAQNEQKEQEEQAALDYLATWGRIYQKKEALQKQYATRITKAETQGEKDSLAKELEEKLAGLNMEELKNTINWDLVFSGIEHATKKQLQSVRKQLEAFRNSEEYKTATPENIKTITEAIANIDSALADKSGFFGGLSNAIRDYRKALEESKTAQEKLNEAIQAGDKALMEDAQAKKNSADNRVQQTSTAVGKAADTMGGKFKTLAGVMGNLSKETLSLSDVGGAIEQVTAALGASGSKWAGLVAGVLSLLDVAANDVEGFTEGLVKKIGAALASLTAYFVKTATFGLVDIGPASYKEYEKVYARYERMMNLWEDLLAKQKEFLEQAVGDEVMQAAGALRKTLEAEIQAAKATASARLDSGASTGSHSISYRMWKGSYRSVDGQNWQDVAGAISGRLGVRFNSMYDMLDMSAEQLQWIKENYTNLWAAMDGDFADLLDKLIAKQEEFGDIVDKTKESLTRVSFDSLYDSFADRLADMSSDAEDFADDFSGYLQKAVTSIISSKYKAKLKDWYDMFAAGNEDGEISKTELEVLQKGWNEITEAAVKERDALAKIYGWDSSANREAVAKGIATASQESVDENNGRLTAIQGHTFNINENVAAIREMNARVVANTGDLLRSVLAIEEHTGSMSARLQNVESGMEAVKNAVNDISLRGVKIR